MRASRRPARARLLKISLAPGWRCRAGARPWRRTRRRRARRQRRRRRSVRRRSRHGLRSHGPCSPARRPASLGGRHLPEPVAARRHGWRSTRARRLRRDGRERDRAPHGRPDRIGVRVHRPLRRGRPRERRHGRRVRARARERKRHRPLSVVLRHPHVDQVRGGRWRRRQRPRQRRGGARHRERDRARAAPPTCSSTTGQNSHSGAPGSGPFDTFRAIIDQDRAQVVSVSWGECEQALGSADAAAENTLFEQAAVQGQTIVAAAGDSGSEDCAFGSNQRQTQLAVDDPSSQPFVTGVGGTTLQRGRSAPDRERLEQRRQRCQPRWRSPAPAAAGSPTCGRCPPASATQPPALNVLGAGRHRRAVRSPGRLLPRGPRRLGRRRPGDRLRDLLDNGSGGPVRRSSGLAGDRRHQRRGAGVGGADRAGRLVARLRCDKVRSGMPCRRSTARRRHLVRSRLQRRAGPATTTSRAPTAAGSRPAPAMTRQLDSVRRTRPRSPPACAPARCASALRARSIRRSARASQFSSRRRTSRARRCAFAPPAYRPACPSSPATGRITGQAPAPFRHLPCHGQRRGPPGCDGGREVLVVGRGRDPDPERVALTLERLRPASGRRLTFTVATGRRRPADEGQAIGSNVSNCRSGSSPSVTECGSPRAAQSDSARRRPTER